MVIFISGQRNSKKTATALKLYGVLTASGIQTGGFVSPADYVNGTKSVYHIKNPLTGKTVHLLNLSQNGPQINPAGFAYAKQLLTQAAKKSRVVIIDEFGRLELEHQGYFSHILPLVHGGPHCIITLRTGREADAARQLGLTQYHNINLDADPPFEEVTAQVKTWLCI